MYMKHTGKKPNSTYDLIENAKKGKEEEQEEEEEEGKEKKEDGKEGVGRGR